MLATATGAMGISGAPTLPSLHGFSVEALVPDSVDREMKVVNDEGYAALLAYGEVSNRHSLITLRAGPAL